MATWPQGKVSKELRRMARDLIVNRVAASVLIPDRIRWRFYRLAGRDIDPCRIAGGSFIGSGTLHVGRGAMLSGQLFLDPSAGISLGENTRVGMRTVMITASHTIGDTESTRTDRQAGTEIHKPIEIGDNVWVGANCTILPGVSIGPGVVLAAGSVLTTDCRANTLYAGVPARLIRELPT